MTPCLQNLQPLLLLHDVVCLAVPLSSPSSCLTFPRHLVLFLALVCAIGILPHHKWFNFPWFVVGGVVVGRPVPLFKHRVRKKVADLMFFDRSFKDASLYAAIAGAIVV